MSVLLKPITLVCDVLTCGTVIRTMAFTTPDARAYASQQGWDCSTRSSLEATDRCPLHARPATEGDPR